MGNKKSCYNCQYSRLINERKKVDCINGNVSYELLDKYKENPYLLPGMCGEYKPELVEECKNCGEKINQPIFSWHLWVEDVFEELAVCSRRCQEKLQEKLDKRTDNFTFNLDENEEYPF